MKLRFNFIILFLFFLSFNNIAFAYNQKRLLSDFVAFITSEKIASFSEDNFKKKLDNFGQIDGNKFTGNNETEFMVEGNYMFSGCHGILEAARFTIKSSYYKKIKSLLDKQYSGKSKKKKGKAIFGSCPKVTIKEISKGNNTFVIIVYNCLDVC